MLHKGRNFTFIQLGLVLLCIAAFLYFTEQAAAQQIANEALTNLQPVASGAGVQQSGTVETSIGEIVRIMLGISGIFFFALMVYAGIRWILARGEEQQIDEARRTLVAAIIGLCIMIGAYAISVTVTSGILGNITTSNPLGTVQTSQGQSSPIVCCIFQVRTLNDDPFAVNPPYWIYNMIPENDCRSVQPAPGTEILTVPEIHQNTDAAQCRTLINAK